MNNEQIKGLQPTDKEQVILDSGKGRVTGLRLRVSPRGAKVFYLFYTFNGRLRKYKIGKFPEINLQEARKIAKQLRSKIALGIDPQAEKVEQRKQGKASKAEGKKARALVLRNYLEERYYPHALPLQKSPARTVQLLEGNFKFLMKKRMDEISKFEIQKWMKERQKEGIKASTINRAITALKAVLNHAVKDDLLVKSPLHSLSRLRVEDPSVVRFLSDEEEAKIIRYLDEKSGYFPVLIKTLLHTGLRPKEAFTLTWASENGGTVDLDARLITVLSSYSKVGKTRHIPMNDYLHAELSAWRVECPSHWLFPSRLDPNKHVTTVQRPWERMLRELGITNLRLYDLRHTFASKLVMRGASLYEVSVLLGHSDVNMSKIYAHLSTDHLASVVDRLV